MRRRPSSLATATAAIVSAALVVAGCEARVYGTPPDDTDTPQLTVVAPQNTAGPAAGSPARGAGRGVRRPGRAHPPGHRRRCEVRSRYLGRRAGSQHRPDSSPTGTTRPFPIASVVKLFIADDLLLQESKGQTTLSPADRKSLDVMLRSSDDSAAQNFWNRSGGNAVIARVKARYGLAGTTAPYNGHWDVTLSTASDLVRYYDMLLDGSGGLPPEQANVIMGNLAQSTPTGIDGYPQRFGIPEGLYAEPVAVKQGWFCCWNGGNQLHVSTGVIGPDRRYVMAISSLEPGDYAAARATITQAVKTMFPGGKI